MGDEANDVENEEFIDLLLEANEGGSVSGRSNGGSSSPALQPILSGANSENEKLGTEEEEQTAKRWE
jgi:hypothetical protein